MQKNSQTKPAEEIKSRIKAAAGIVAFPDRDPVLAAIATDAARDVDLEDARDALQKMTAFPARDDAIGEVARQLAAAGKRPFLVGGTGLYISAIVEGYELVDVPPNDPLRVELESLPLPKLVERLENCDPDAARRIDKSNRRRLIRALEIAAGGRAHTAAQQRSPRYRCLQLGLTWPREILEARIEKRLRDRLSNGMIDEVAGLRVRGVSDLRLDKLGLEYRYITRYLRGEFATLDDLRRELVIAIRQFAKGQLTWFKRDRRILWLDPAGDCFQAACDRIREWEAESRV